MARVKPLNGLLNGERVLCRRRRCRRLLLRQYFDLSAGVDISNGTAKSIRNTGNFHRQTDRTNEQMHPPATGGNSN